MERTAVESSVITSVGYDPQDRCLEIEFRSGGVYQYFGVEPALFEGLLNAASKGTYFAQHVRNEGLDYTQVR